MWFSPLFLEEYSRDRARTLSQHLAQCRLAEALQPAPPSRWRRLLARRLATLSLRLDRREALATLNTGPYPLYSRRTAPRRGA
jgi:hypothetical protein